MTVLLGASGAGKSTLIRAIAGVLTEGESVGELAVNGVVGLVMQDPSGNIVMEAVGDDVAFGLENRAADPAGIWPTVEGALCAVGLGVDRQTDTGHLSGGQQQLLALAAASALRPDILLLDEPTANLDPTAAARVVQAVLALRQDLGCTVVLVEHRVAPWLHAVDRAVVLVPGGAARSVVPSELPALVTADPELAGRIWLDHGTVLSRPPRRPVGELVLGVRGVAVAGRLADPRDLDVHSGEVVALLGPPGSGKSTLLACLSGLLRPSGGTVQLRSADGGGRGDPWRWSSQEVAKAFGVVFQNPEHQFLTSRVRDELAHGLAVAGAAGAPATARVERLLVALNLAPLAAANPFTLSGGEQRRLSVGTALIRDPGVLLLDEPTFGQDPATWSAVIDLIADHRDAGGAVLLATHDPQLVTALGAREVHMPVAAVPARSAKNGAQGSGLRRLNPLTMLCCATALSLAGLMSGSVVANLLLAAFSTGAALVGRVPVRRLATLSAPALLAAASVGLSNALLAAGGPMMAANWAAAALPASRVLAVALPGLIAAIALDATALADSLTRWLRVPPRAAYSVLAGLRLLPLLSAEWVTLRQASRARGVAGRGAVARAAEFVSLAFRLLVAALRRGSKLAVALDCRGLSNGPRTQARPPHLGWRDGVCVAAVAAWLATLALLPAFAS